MIETSPLSQSPKEAVTPLPALRILPPIPELRESNALLERHLEKTAAFDVSHRPAPNGLQANTSSVSPAIIAIGFLRTQAFVKSVAAMEVCSSFCQIWTSRASTFPTNRSKRPA